MSQAIAGSRGTRFILTETGSESKLEVTEGTVAYRSKVDSTEVLVSAGESVTATAGGLGEKTHFDPAAFDGELVRMTTMDAPVTTPVDPTTSKGNGESAEKGSGMMWYGMLIAIVALISLGLWVLKNKHKAE
jgi:hypothetical protein